MIIMCKNCGASLSDGNIINGVLQLNTTCDCIANLHYALERAKENIYRIEAQNSSLQLDIENLKQHIKTIGKLL